MIYKKLKAVAYRLNRVFNPDPEFSKRIKYRYKTFWKDDLSPLPLFVASDPIYKWKYTAHWQRALEHKFNSREFAKKYGCKVPGLLWYGQNFDEIDFSTLPKHFVVKPTLGHSSRSVYLMSDGTDLLTGTFYTLNELKASLKQLTSLYPEMTFIIEEFAANEKGDFQIPVDYKFYMFNGEIACIQVINRGTLIEGAKTGTVNYYNENWTSTDKIKTSSFKDGSPQQKPKCLQEMVQSAKVLSRAYEIFVRVDFYATDKGAVFGEFSPTPDGGHSFTKAGSKYLMEKWEIYCKNMI